MMQFSNGAHTIVLELGSFQERNDWVKVVQSQIDLLRKEPPRKKGSIGKNGKVHKKKKKLNTIYLTPIKC